MAKDVTIILGDREIFAEKHSVSAQEVYTVGQQGLKSKYKFKVHAFEYNDESFLIYDGVKYVIYRTYEPDEKTELYAGTKAGVF